jgi:enoyl-[acyl-carrier protein] reductase I
MSTGNLLDGKKGIVLGVANKRSIAWGIASALSEAGATLAFTYQGERLQRRVEELVTTLPGESPLYPCDVTNDDEISSLGEGLKRDLGGIDFLIHCIAFADKDDLARPFSETSRAGYLLAQEVSSYSLTALARMAVPLMESGGSIQTMTYLGSERAVRNYNVMGVAKAALESSVRYLASDLGEKGIRVNAISAGPINTLAARGIAGFTEILGHVAENSPLRRNVTVKEVAGTSVFLASDLSSGITGEIIYVDCGYNIVGL